MKSNVRLTAKGEVEHPAKFSDSVLTTIRAIIQRIMDEEGVDHATVLDPFGGVGKIHDIASPFIHTHTIELEWEWCEVAASKGPSVCMDMFNFYPQLPFNFVATSITYGNRMADHHDARDGSKRNTYKHVLGRDLSVNNSGALQWGAEYRDFHRRAFRKIRDEFLCGENGGYFILNTKDHIRKDEVQGLTEWCGLWLSNNGFTRVARSFVPSKGNGEGQNGQTRVAGEWVTTWRVRL